MQYTGPEILGMQPHSCRFSWEFYNLFANAAYSVVPPAVTRKID